VSDCFVNAKMRNCSAMSWREQVTFNEMKMMSACTRPTQKLSREAL